MNEEKLKEAASLYTQGNKLQSAKILGEIVRSDPSNAMAWYGLAMSLDDPPKKIFCLKKVVSLDPSHEKAQQLLEKLNSESSPLFASIKQTSVPEKITGKPQITKKPHGNKLSLLLIGGALLLIVCFSIFGVIVWLKTSQVTLQGISQIPQSSKLTPDKEAIGTMILHFTANRGATGWENQQVTDFTPLRLSQADEANGIQERVCITLSYIEKDDQGDWQDKSISYSMEKKQDKWQVDKDLMESNNIFDVLPRMLSGNCDFAKDYHGVP